MSRPSTCRHGRRPSTSSPSPSCPGEATKLCFAPMSQASTFSLFPSCPGEATKLCFAPMSQASTFSLFPSCPGETTKLCFAPMSRASTSYFFRAKNVDGRDKPGHDADGSGPTAAAYLQQPDTIAGSSATFLPFSSDRTMPDVLPCRYGKSVETRIATAIAPGLHWEWERGI